jgi:glycosyltransferase involved in cell wall biosynthesis
MGKNDLFPLLSDNLGRLSQAAVKCGDRIGVRGARTRQWLIEQGVDADRIFIQHNVHDFELFKPMPDAKTEYDLIYVGFLAKYKTLDVLLDAVAAVAEKRPETRLLMVGDGGERERLKEKCKTLGISGNVDFIGNRNFNELPRLYNSARMFVMTSQGEGLPMVMIEGMSCGLPAVVPADADIEEIAKDGVNAIVVPRPEARLFADAVLSLLTDPALYDKLAQGAVQIREIYRDEFSGSVQARRWKDALLAIVAERR